MWDWLESGGPYSSGAAVAVVCVTLAAVAFLGVANGISVLRGGSASIDLAGHEFVLRGARARAFGYGLLVLAAFCLASLLIIAV